MKKPPELTPDSLFADEVADERSYNEGYQAGFNEQDRLLPSHDYIDETEWNRGFDDGVESAAEQRAVAANKSQINKEEAHNLVKILRELQRRAK